jgi:ABC-2 type transport system permease protein
VSPEPLIHDQGYRRYAGRRHAVGSSWIVIARNHIRATVRQRRILALLVFSWVPFVVRAVQIYVASSFDQARFLAATPQTFREFLVQQSIFVFLVSMALGGLIADDRRANALQLYLSKPLTRIEYIGGKLVVLMVFLLGITMVPALLLLLLQTMFSGSFAFVTANLFLLPAIVLFSLLQALVSAFALLALSSLSRSRRFVAAMYAGTVFFTSALVQILRAMTGSRAWAWLSPRDLLDVVAAAVFRSSGTPSIPLPVALLAIAVIVGGSIAILERRVRAVEIIR